MYQATKHLATKTFAFEKQTRLICTGRFSRFPGWLKWHDRFPVALRGADCAASNCYASFARNRVPADEKRTET